MSVCKLLKAYQEMKDPFIKMPGREFTSRKSPYENPGQEHIKVEVAKDKFRQSAKSITGSNSFILQVLKLWGLENFN